MLSQGPLPPAEWESPIGSTFIAGELFSGSIGVILGPAELSTVVCGSAKHTGVFACWKVRTMGLGG